MYTQADISAQCLRRSDIGVLKILIRNAWFLLYIGVSVDTAYPVIAG